MDKRWWTHPFVLGLLAPWIVYAVLLALQPDDALATWRNQVVWPATSYLTAAQSGIALPLLGHVLVGGIGGVLLQWPLAALAGKLGSERLGRVVSLTVLAVFPLVVFAHLKAVPDLLTVIDGTSLHVRGFAEAGRWPVRDLRIPAADIEALSVRATRHHFDGDPIVLLAATTRSHGTLLLGQRDCDDREACLTAGDEAMSILAERLGLDREEQPRAVEDTHVLLVRRR